MSPAEFAIRQAGEADLAAILALERSIPAAPHWSADLYRAIVQETQVPLPSAGPHRRLLVAISSVPPQRLLGFAGGVAHSEGAELETVAVAGSARRRGVGAALCLAIAAWARTLGATGLSLEVRASSVAALGLYRKLGFEAAGIRPQYYSRPVDDAVLMRLVFPSLR